MKRGFFLRSLLVGFTIGQCAFPFSAFIPSNLRAESFPTLLPRDQMLLKETPPPPPPNLSDMEMEIEKARFIRFSQAKWNEMRRRLESGEELAPEVEKPAPPVVKKQLPPPPPIGPGINVVLPYESGLSISGRKLIDFKVNSTIYSQPDLGKGRVDKSDFSLNQQMQVRVKGTVGRKVTVNVDYDDTQEDKRNVNMLYKGDPDEVLQEATFGDITISLPSTEFVSYSKSVFGVRANLLFRPRSGFAKLFPTALWHRNMPKEVKLYLIGSRTKGITQTKRFTGNFVLNRKEINDISYARRQFYQLAFDTGPAPLSDDRPIQVGSEKIFLWDQNPFTINVNQSTRTFKVFESTLTSTDGLTPSTQTFAGPSGPNTGLFLQLVPGVDYTVDYLKGVIHFKRIIQQRDVIAVDYSSAGAAIPMSQSRGGLDPQVSNPSQDVLKGFSPLLLKPDETQFFATRELKNYYNLGDTKIARDDGKGNFILKIQDLQNNDATSIVGMDVSSNTQVKPVLTYPANIDVDFENGIFSFVSTDTFRSSFPHPFTDDIYNFVGDVPSFKNRYRIFAEYRFKQGNFNLGQINIVSQSEQVFVDGRKMTRDVDYFIDYDVGIVTFFRPELIRDDSIVEITYDYSPFGGTGQETLVGMRSEWYATDNLFFGNSVLLNFAPQTLGVPDLRSTSRSITVLEADLNWKNIKFGQSNFGINNLAAEIAESIKNPNTANKAMVESFEGIKLDDPANMNLSFWQVASNPETGNTGSSNGAFQPGWATITQGGRGILLGNEDVKTTDINPIAPVESSDRLQALDVNYRLDAMNEASSIVQVINKNGLDFFSNRRQFLEMWIYGDNNGERLQVRLGGVNELSDSGTTLRTEDKQGTGVLGPGEDIGWAFINPDGSTTTIGAGNGRLDTQDLNGNGRLDPDDHLGNYLNEIGGPGNPLTEPNGTAHAAVDWSGWKVFQCPLNINTTDQAIWSAIKDIRIAVVNPTSSQLKGTLRFARVSVVGTRFEAPAVLPSTAPVSVQVFAENNQDNPGYPALFGDAGVKEDFKNLFDITDQTPRRREQALAIRYQRTGTTTDISSVSTRDSFTTPLDFTDHETLNFYLNGDLSGNNFFLRIGNPGNYFEYSTPLTFAGWRKITLDILNKSKSGNLDRLFDKGSGVWTSRVGSPSLRNITQITMGVYVQPGGTDPAPHKIYVDKIHLTDSVKQVGVAYRANSDFTYKGWAAWGGRWRFVDRNFQTLTSVGSGVDKKDGSAYMNLTRLKFMPLATNMSYSETVTPQIQTINDPNILVPSIDVGKNISTNQTMSGNFLMTQLSLIPSFIRTKLLNVDFSADHSLALRSSGDREDETFNYRYGSSYSFPWRPNVLPFWRLNFRPLPTSVAYSFSQTNSYLRFSPTQKLLKNDDTHDIGENYSLRLAFDFVPNHFSLSPSYTFSRSLEERASYFDVNGATLADSNYSSGYHEFYSNYPKTENQTVSFSGNLRLVSWLAPSYNYSITTAENYNVNQVIFGTATFNRGTLKSIGRSSNADVSASLSPKDMFKYVPYLRIINHMINSLNFSGGYTLTDGDNYENADAGFYVRDQLFIRSNPLDLSGQNPNARRTNLTATDTSRLSGRWSPFEGFDFMRSKLWTPLKNLNTSGTYTETKTSRDTTGTLSFSYSRVWPDFVFSTTGLEKTLFLSRWMSDTRLNGNYQERLSEVQAQTRNTGFNLGSDFTFTLFKLLQFSVGYTNTVSQDEDLKINQVTNRTTSKGFNGQVITTLKWGNWRFTPHYDQSQSESENGNGKKLSDTTTRNASLQIFGDANIPRFFRMPFGKQLTLTNRFIFTSTLHYGMVRDGVNDAASKDTFDSNVNGDFEITPNVRAGVGANYGFTRNIVKTEEDFTTFGFSSRITIQF